MAWIHLKGERAGLSVSAMQLFRPIPWSGLKEIMEWLGKFPVGSSLNEKGEKGEFRGTLQVS